jgi:hypothetical protein
MGPRPLEDLPDVRVPVGFDARVEDRVENGMLTMVRPW